MFGVSLNKIYERYSINPMRYVKEGKRTNLETRLGKTSPFPSFVRIKVGGSFYHGNFLVQTHDHIKMTILEDLGNIRLYSEEDMQMKIEVRPKSTYKFKKSLTSLWETYRDGEHTDGDENSKFDDDDYVTETYYAIVDAKDIPKFIEESGEMANGEDKIDPIKDGKFHAVVVYVVSKEVSPNGIGELVKRMGECRNKSLVLYVTEEGAREFIESMEQPISIR